jgi:D-alanyl-lipoteichoic acid acyltransferase DltB (MBOAT superfamily)
MAGSETVMIKAAGISRWRQDADPYETSSLNHSFKIIIFLMKKCLSCIIFKHQATPESQG